MIPDKESLRRANEQMIYEVCQDRKCLEDITVWSIRVWAIAVTGGAVEVLWLAWYFNPTFLWLFSLFVIPALEIRRAYRRKVDGLKVLDEQMERCLEYRKYLRRQDRGF